MAERLRSIPLINLTRTFADSIHIARKMGIQYVWIDSLCIIQDSRSDWEKEAAQMASVYSNAYCTISASGSADGHGGCRVDQNSQPYGPVTLVLNNTDENGNSTTEKVRIFSLFGTHISSVLTTDPLGKRGWTFQERELSPRILHYSKDSIRWECQSLKASFQFPWGDELAFNGARRVFDAGQIGPGPRPTVKSSLQEIDTAIESDHEKNQQLKTQQAWFEAVLNYTSRSLTKQPDILPALSGIAQAVTSRTGDAYLAGLWHSNLLHCLLWASAWCDPKSLMTHTRHDTYLAPSWSWASIRGPVRYGWWIFNALHPNPNVHFLPRILEAKTIPAGIDPFGALEGGFIRLKGKIKPAMTRGEGFARQDREGVYVVQEGKMAKIGDIRYDVPAEAPSGQFKVIFCLCVYPREERWGDCVGLAMVLSGIGFRDAGGLV